MHCRARLAADHGAGCRADDVIGTLARQAAAQGIEVVISTGDKDLAQLVDKPCDAGQHDERGAPRRSRVLAKFGVPPERIVDYLTLMGDTVDNVPGVVSSAARRRR